MQVLLRQNVEKLGSRGDVVNVKDGYARNYLIPRGIGLAVKSTDLKSVEAERKRLQKITDKERMEIAALAERLSAASVTITAKANEEGHLFGSVGPKDIADMLTRDVAPIEESAVRLDPHIKVLGVYEVPVHLSAEVEVPVKVYVVGE